MAPPKPTIAHVVHRLYLAGAEVLAAALSRRRRERFNFVFLCLDEIGPLGRELAEEGFAVIDLQRRPGVDLSVATRLHAACREHDVRLLHAHQYTPFFYAAMSRAFPTRVGPILRGRPPVLFTEHGRHYPDYRRPKRVLANKALLRRNDGVTAVGRFVKQCLVDHEGIAARRIEVVYNGIDPQKFDKPDDATRRAVRTELGIDDDERVVMQVARFHPVKDHATAIRAFAHAVGQQPKARLVLVGDGDERPKLETLIAELGVSSRVDLLGVRNDVPRLMAAADVFMLSSLSEGISVTLLEAMASHLPIVTTDVGGNSEIVADGETGLLSPRRDHEALGKNLLRVIDDPQLSRQMGDAGRQRLLETFTEQQMHERFAAIYEEMLG